MERDSIILDEDMCQKRNSVHRKINGVEKRLDSCIADMVVKLNVQKIKTIMSCCGHGVYPISIIVEVEDIVTKEECLTNLFYPFQVWTKKRNLYRTDSNGLYYLG